jgi:HupE / UreJ protein
VFALTSEAAGVFATLGRFGREGVLHIWQGLDHVLFLFVLLLPAVLRRERGRWLPVPSLRAAFGEVVRIVTAFTAAHSLTLAFTAASRSPAVVAPACNASRLS